MTVRYALVGAGTMGQEHIRNINLIDGAEVVAIADPNDAMREKAQQTAGPNCAAYSSYHDMLSTGGFDALLVASPNHTHHPIMMDIMEAGHPILCEKPLGITAHECEQIEAKANALNVPVWVAMEYRYMPPVTRLVEEVRAGTAGNVRMLSIREHRYPFLSKVGDWNRYEENTGGTLVEKCCHFFDLMRLVLQANPVRVFASGSLDVNHLNESHLSRPADMIDNAFVIVDFDSGARSMLDLCMFAEGSRWQESISATGELARVDALIPGPARFSETGATVPAELAVSARADMVERRETIALDPAVLHAGDHYGSTFYQHQKFIEMVRNGGKPEVSIRDGLYAVKVGAAAEVSAKTGQAVDLA